MTMAPGRKKKGFLLEIIFISILLFLLMGSRSHRGAGPTAAGDFSHPLQRGLALQPITLK